MANRMKEQRMTVEVEIEAAIAAYRREIESTAELARGDLDEIEDHLRTLTDELRESGMPAALAVTEAAKRLGDPSALAREHARVRPPFGAKLSPARAWSAAALLAVLLGWFVTHLPSSAGAFSSFHPILELACGVVLLAAMIARLSWARPILLGGMACYATTWLAYSAVEPTYLLSPLLVAQLGLVAFLAPWRRGELSAPGIALALQVWAYCTGVYVFHPSAPFTIIALIAPVLATIGIILRARWSALFAIASALMIGATAVRWLSIEVSAPYFWVSQLVITSGALAAAISAVVQFRTARSNLGSFEAVLR
jgi:hypothetical protein